MIRYTGMAFAVFLACLTAGAGAAQEKSLTLVAPQALIDSGLLDYIRPRFSLKTGVRITVLPEGAGDALIGTDPNPGFAGEALSAKRAFHAVGADGETVYYVAVTNAAPPHAAAAERFADWLLSDIGQNTLGAYTPESAAPYVASAGLVEVVEVVTYDGDPVLGAKLAQANCGRCHAVDPSKRMNDLGSTPSFGALKALPNWEYRFQVFYTSNPHPSFTQIEDVTPPFDQMLPPPIVPVELSQDDVEAILAFVAGMPAADLGAPVKLQ